MIRAKVNMRDSGAIVIVIVIMGSLTAIAIVTKHVQCNPQCTTLIQVSEIMLLVPWSLTQGLDRPKLSWPPALPFGCPKTF